MPARLRPIAAFCALSVSFASIAHADPCSPASRVSTCVDSDNFMPHAGATRFATIGSAELVAPHQLAVGLVSTLQEKPIVLSFPIPGGRADAPAIQTQLNATFLWAYGLTKGIELDAAVPYTFYQDGTGSAAVKEQDPAPIVRSAARDVRLGVTGSVLPFGRDGQGLGLVTRMEIALPTGDGSAFARGASGTAIPTVTGEYRRGRITAAVELGARLRGTSPVANVTIGSQLLGAAGVSVAILPRELLSASAEAFVLADAAKGGERPSPAEWMVTARSAPALAGDFSVFLGGGSSLDGALTSPAWRFVLGARYAPVGRDADGDGVLDRDDRCPDRPEDRDGFEDEDGCPDPDNDRDGIPDVRDRCRDQPEDKDGIDDEDGCPDLDDDHDGVPDAQDKCRSQPEDRDGFQDDDGCPDPDNDGDGIPDAQDKCPNGPEDKDGFRDEDGCPDPDNDLDGIPDARDKCPNDPEDKDGFQDEDGCPDPDNDHDGILDGDDRCPNEPENIDGVQDDDGCPEPGGKVRVSLAKNRIATVPPLRFAAGKSALTPEIERDLRMIAQQIRAAMPVERVIVEVYGDGPGAAGDKLASARAESVRQVFASAKLPAGLVTVANGDPEAKRAPGASHLDVTVLPPAQKATPKLRQPT